MVCRATAFLFLPACLLVSACQEEAEVAVTQDQHGIAFATTPFRGSVEACITNAYVYVEGAGDPKQIWYATRGSAREPCLREVRFSANPDGFSAQPAPKLEAGKSYRVGLTGMGFTAATSFIAK